MLSECIGSKPEFMALQVAPPVIGLALGKTAVTYNQIEGTRSGEDLMASMFGEDMGNTGMYSTFRTKESLTMCSMLELHAARRALSSLAFLRPNGVMCKRISISI